MAFSDATDLTHVYPSARKSNPSNSGSPPAEQHRRDRNVQFINEAFTKILPDRVRPAANPHVLSGSSLACAVECLANAACDEVERRAAVHLDGGSRMMGQDEHRNVVRRAIAPPAFPVHVRPFPANGAEHVAPENPGPDILKATGSELIVHPGRTAVLAEQGLLECARRDQPLVQFNPAIAERIIDVLIRTRSISVEREGEACNSNACHRFASV